MTAWRFRVDSARIVAVWDGPCPGCGSLIVAPLSVDLDPERWAIPPTAGAVLDGSSIAFTGDGRRHRRPAPPSIPAGPRLDRLRAIAAETIAAGELDSDHLARLGARWLGWRPERIPHPPAIAGDPAERDTLLLTAWRTARDYRPVRYSQPGSSSPEPRSSVRESRPAAGGNEADA